MGLPNEYDHPDTIAMLQRIIDTADRHHVAAGCWFGTTAQALRTIRQGARLVVYSNDALILKNAMHAAFTELKQG
jgi:2-keto-3-deoxy-L-rhamnonate aldolase RhmA